MTKNNSNPDSTRPMVDPDCPIGRPIDPPADLHYHEAHLPLPESARQVEESNQEEAFRAYFHDLLDEILDGAIPKAKTYGTHELVALGRTLNQTYRPDQVLTDSQAIQVACWFYASGKLARWNAAQGRGEQPTTDTVLDLMVYCLMWLKVSETGEWWS